MDNTAVCVFPWEMDILRLVHDGHVEEVSIEVMSNQKEGVAKIEKLKLKHTNRRAPDIAGQLELMVYVDPEDDPCNDPAAEYNRLGALYGMDKEFPIPCVERIYGQFTSGAFTTKLAEFAKDRAPRPAVLGERDEPEERQPSDMSVTELREELKSRGIKYKVTEGKVDLAARLAAHLEPA